MNNSEEISKVEIKIKNILAEQLGVETDDINNSDSFTDHLHMSASDMANFIHKLEKDGFSVSKLDFSDINTVINLIEALS